MRPVQRNENSNEIIIYPKCRQSNLVVQELEDEVLIYDLTENKAFCLNQTSALVWQACDGNHSISQITEFIGQKLNSTATEELVSVALDQLKKEGLIECNLPHFFSGQSRREIIKRVGLGTAIALPLIATFPAPIAIHAQSGSCSACSKKGDPCAPGCENFVGTCYDNAGCGGGQCISNVTCSVCKSGIFGGGTGTGSWVGLPPAMAC